MSRMLGILSKGNISPLWFETFGDASVAREKNQFVAYDKQGLWDVAGYLGNWSVHFGKGSKKISEDSGAYTEACNRAILSGSRIILTYIQRAYGEYPEIERGNPSIYGSWIFCNKGTVIDSEKLLLPGYKYDSACACERLSKYIVEKLEHRSAANYPSAIRQAVAEIRQKCQVQFLSFLLSDGKHILAYRDLHDAENLSSLHYADTKNAFVFCSEKMPGFEWESMKKGEVVIADRYELNHGL